MFRFEKAKYILRHIASKQVMGVETVIDRFSLSIVKQSVSIEGLRLYQPESFPEGVFIDITEVSASCNVALLLRKKNSFSQTEFEYQRGNLDKG
ncbi:MAG: hypothetical protein NUV86_01535 [Candidatus Scalindua sp.]|nr:hypothetical protein [Candidatus Scalindua sp.]